MWRSCGGTLKNNWDSETETANSIKYSFKSLKSNDLQYLWPHRSSDAQACKRHRNRENTPLLGLKRHARTACSYAFPHTWRTHERFGISVPRPHLEGNVWTNGQSECKNGGNKGKNWSSGKFFCCLSDVHPRPTNAPRKCHNFVLVKDSRLEYLSKKDIKSIGKN